MSSVIGASVGVMVTDGVIDGVRVGTCVAVLLGWEVALGAGRVAVGGSVEARLGDGTGEGVADGAGVKLGGGVALGVRDGGGIGLAVVVLVTVAVRDGVDVGAVVGVALGNGVGLGVGGSPSRAKRPEACQSVPKNSWTS